MLYIVVNIGCIECVVPSGLVGVFEDKDEALKVQRQCAEKLRWRNEGQNYYQIFEIESTNFNMIIDPYDYELSDDYHVEIR